MSETKTKTAVQPRMLEDAVFSMASEDSDFDIWVMTADGGMHGLIAEYAIQLSTLGGKGPDRFRKWLIKYGFLRHGSRNPKNGLRMD